MKNKKIIKGALIFSILALAGGGVLMAQAAEEDDSLLGRAFNKNKFRSGLEKTGMFPENRGSFFESLSEEEKAEKLAEREARRAEGAFKREEFQVERDARRAEAEARRAEMELKKEEIKAAVLAKDFETFKALIPKDCPFLENINADNFTEIADKMFLKPENGEGFRFLNKEKGQKNGSMMGRGMGLGGQNIE